MSGATPPRILIDTGPLLAESGGSLSVCESIQSPGLTVGDDAFAFLGPVQVELRLDGTVDLVVLTGTVTVSARTECVRCLTQFELVLDAELDVCLVEPGGEETLPDDQERLVIDEEVIDVWPLVESALGGAAPFAPVHDASCVGLCVTCGADLNTDPCDCDTDTVDSPFAVLQGMFEDDRTSEDA